MKTILIIILLAITSAAVSQNYPKNYSLNYETSDKDVYMLRCHSKAAFVNGTDTIFLRNIIIFDSAGQTSYLRGIFVYDTKPVENYTFVFNHAKYQFYQVNKKSNTYVPKRSIYWFEIINELQSIEKDGKTYTPAFKGCESYFQESMIGFKSIDAYWYTF